MKRLFYIYVVLGLMMTSCTLETSDNGDLDGVWLMQTVDTVKTGGSTDVREQLICWSFQMNMMQLRHPKRMIDFHFQHEGNQLILKDAVIDNRLEGDPIITDVEIMREVGLSQIQDTFTVISLSSSNLELANDEYYFHFRKY